MIIGAISGFALMVVTDNLFFAVVGSMISGVIISVIFGFLTQSLLTNHVATGLAEIAIDYAFALKIAEKGS